MSDEAAFLEALKANPADDTARLVYADWLDEHDQPQKAQYLREVVEAVRDDEPNPERVIALADQIPIAWRIGAAARFGLVFESIEGGRKVEAIKLVRELTGMGLSEAKNFVERAPSGFLHRTTLECANGVVRYFGPGRLRISPDISLLLDRPPVAAEFSVYAELRHPHSWDDDFVMPPEALSAFRVFLATVGKGTVAEGADLADAYHYTELAKELSYTLAKEKIDGYELLLPPNAPQREWFIFLYPAIHFGPLS